MPNTEDAPQNGPWGQRFPLEEGFKELIELGIAEADIDRLFPLLKGNVRLTEIGLNQGDRGQIIVNGMGVYGFSSTMCIYYYWPERKEAELVFQLDEYRKVKPECRAGKLIVLDKRVSAQEGMDSLCKFFECDQAKLLEKFPLMKDWTGIMMNRLSPHNSALDLNGTGTDGKPVFIYEITLYDDKMVQIFPHEGGPLIRMARHGRR